MSKPARPIFKKCQACHSGEKGGPNKVGPDSGIIVDRPVAEHEGFAYSAGMKEFSKGGTEKWTYDNINHFITSPKKFVKGTAMGFAGLPKDEDRANVIAYLRTLSDNPKPLPKPVPTTLPPSPPTPPPSRPRARPSRRQRAGQAGQGGTRRPPGSRPNDQIVIQLTTKKPGSARLFLLVGEAHMAATEPVSAVSRRQII